MSDYRLREAGAEEFERFAATASNSTVHCRAAYLETLGAARFRRLLLDRGGEVVLGTLLPLDAAGAPQAKLHLFSGYQGLLASPRVASLPVHSRHHEMIEATQALLALLDPSCGHMAFRFHPHVEDLRAWQWFHYHEPALGRFTLDLRYTGLIEFPPGRSFEDYLGTIRSSKRRQFRLAARAGLKAEDSRDVDALVHLYGLTFDRQGIAKDEEELHWVRRIAEEAVARGFGDLLLVRAASGEPASATLFLHDGRSGIYLFGANDPRFRNDYSGIYAFVEALRRCHARGLQWVDVGGINSPERGDFKIAFNAAPRPFVEARWSRPSTP